MMYTKQDFERVAQQLHKEQVDVPFWDVIQYALTYAAIHAEYRSCPTCHGPADNGHDRELPPNTYDCTKCEETT